MLKAISVSSTLVWMHQRLEECFGRRDKTDIHGINKFICEWIKTIWIGTWFIRRFAISQWLSLTLGILKFCFPGHQITQMFRVNCQGIRNNLGSETWIKNNNQKNPLTLHFLKKSFGRANILHKKRRETNLTDLSFFFSFRLEFSGTTNASVPFT